MSKYITIDGGTTNTRIILLQDNKLVDAIKINVGARKSIEDKELLKTAIKHAIKELLEKNGLDEKDIACILASGMITSEFGLCHLEHIEAPAGICELNNSIKKMNLGEITEIPFFISR